uniref:4a-hydroxytetrahydrobiopterin dehydratase n=1 Tax=Wuchereria bancrofti TaxID=6293 RepID=A0A1I8EBC2_WUCBA
MNGKKSKEGMDEFQIEVTLSSHDVNGLSERDIELATIKNSMLLEFLNNIFKNRSDEDHLKCIMPRPPSTLSKSPN